MVLSFVKLFSVVSVVFQCGGTFQCDFQCHILIVLCISWEGVFNNDEEKKFYTRCKMSVFITCRWSISSKQDALRKGRGGSCC